MSAAPVQLGAASRSKRPLLLRARLVLPLSGPPIENGAVRLHGNRIHAVGRWRELSAGSAAASLDLGEVILLPGLVNAHCHLDYTHMAGQFPPPKVFTEWLKLITETKAGWDVSDYRASWLSGAEMLVRTGCTTVADIEAVPQLLPDLWQRTPLRVISFLEMIGITSRRPPRVVLQEALDKISSLRHPRCRIALSPHAPYSTVPELLRLTAQTARRRRWPVCIHVAESALEYQMFARASGEMFDWLRRSGRDMTDCGLGSPVRHLACCRMLGPNVLAAHANYLGRNDATALRENSVSVVHCPRSHAYFQHDTLPVRRLLRARINVCLGTDSLATVLKSRRQEVQLSMFEEMRALALREPTLSPRKILHMATLNGARALGLEGRVGQLSPGTFADLIALAAPANLRGVYDTVLAHSQPLAGSMIDGRWAIAPRALPSDTPPPE